MTCDGNQQLQVNYTSERNKLTEKGVQNLLLPQAKQWEEEGLDEGGQNYKLFSCKINKYQEYNIKHDK